MAEGDEMFVSVKCQRFKGVWVYSSTHQEAPAVQANSAGKLRHGLIQNREGHEQHAAISCSGLVLPVVENLTVDSLSILDDGKGEVWYVWG